MKILLCPKCGMRPEFYSVQSVDGNDLYRFGHCDIFPGGPELPFKDAVSRWNLYVMQWIRMNEGS